jgi:nitrite reductase/ring-hydroxylating ferredoxin subunit
VITFLVGLAHGVLSTLYYGFFGDRNPVLVLLTYYPISKSLSGFPFERLGFFALLVLFVLAATSHDFWLKNLSPRVWKALHMGVYGEYELLVLHVLLGSAQTHHTVVAPLVLGVGAVTLTGLHLAAAAKSRQDDSSVAAATADKRWVDACDVSELADCRARTVTTPSGESVAVFRYDGKVSAVSNTCVHQGGPLGEGKIVGGCITCPWHGYRYLPDCGQSPPPFTEKIPTYEVRIRGSRVEINCNALPPGTAVHPAMIEAQP